MGHKEKKGFTLIELIMVISIVAILSVSGAYLMIYLVQNSVFIPNQLNMNMLASDALDIMVEGNSQARGLRFSRIITAIDPYRVDFTDPAGQTISCRLDTVTNQLKRKIGANPETLIPYYQRSGISMTGKSGRVFTYYAGDESTITPPVGAANVRRITITLIAKTGTGAYINWEGQSEQSSSIAVKKFQ